MASYGSGRTTSADLPGDSDDDSQQPDYELIDHSPPPPDDEGNAVPSATDHIPDQEPAYELVDHSPPPPDDKVIAEYLSWSFSQT